MMIEEIFEKIDRTYEAYDRRKKWERIVKEFIDVVVGMMEKMETRQERELFDKHLQLFLEILPWIPDGPAYLPGDLVIEKPSNPLLVKFAKYLEVTIALQKMDSKSKDIDKR